jgi:signal transduction histidine kinase
LVRAAQEEVEKIRQITELTLGLHRQSIDPKEVSVSELLDNVLALYRRRIESFGIIVVRRYESNGFVFAVPAELRQVFSNLIINAVDALHDHGTRLVVRVQDSSNWNISQKGIRVTIADDGAGIPPAARSHIFEQFYTTKSDEGTGMGLWVSRDIVNKYGGEIRFKSNVSDWQSGTTFSVFLPARLFLVSN